MNLYVFKLEVEYGNGAILIVAENTDDAIAMLKPRIDGADIVTDPEECKLLLLLGAVLDSYDKHKKEYEPLDKITDWVEYKSKHEERERAFEPIFVKLCDKYAPTPVVSGKWQGRISSARGNNSDYYWKAMAVLGELNRGKTQYFLTHVLSVKCSPGILLEAIYN